MFHVITAVHNRYSITELFVKKLISQDYVGGIHLILVDDGSDDGTEDMVRELIPCEFSIDMLERKSDTIPTFSLTVIRGDGNLWWGGALHEGYKWVRKHLSDCPKEYVVLANDDTDFESDYYSIAAKHLEDVDYTLITGKGYGLISKRIIDKPGLCDYSGHPEDAIIISPNNDGECASTRSLFMKVEDFLGVGGFHPILLPHYGSDTEWTYRAHKRGYRITSFDDLVFWIDESEELTGDNFYDKLTIKKLFSKRSSANPIYKLNFVILMTPIKYLPSQLGRQIGRFFKKIVIFKDIIKRSCKSK